MPTVPPPPDAGPPAQGVGQAAGGNAPPVAGTGPIPFYPDVQQPQGILPGQGYPIPLGPDGYSSGGLVPITYLGYDPGPPLPPPFYNGGGAGALIGVGAYGQGPPVATMPGGNWPGNIGGFLQQAGQDVGGFMGGGIANPFNR